MSGNGGLYQILEGGALRRVFLKTDNKQYNETLVDLLNKNRVNEYFKHTTWFCEEFMDVEHYAKYVRMISKNIDIKHDDKGSIIYNALKQ